MQKLLTAIVLVFGVTTGALAQTSWPERPIRIVVGSSPGASNDYVGRMFADHLGKVLGQPVLIDNKPGAGSSLGVDSVAKAVPDGYTLTVASPPAISVNPALDKRWAAAYTLIPVAKLTNLPLVIAVRPELGVKSVPELIAYIKKNPGKTNFAHSGMGSATHLAGLLFNQLAGTDMVAVAFKGGAPAAQSAVAGETQVTFSTPPSLLPFFQSGRLIGLAVTVPDRSSVLPHLPGMKEVGLPNFKIDLWFGLFAPAGTPPDILRKLYDATNTVLHKPEFKAVLANGGLELSRLGSSAEFAAFVREEHKFWGQLAVSSGAKAD